MSISRLRIRITFLNVERLPPKCQLKWDNEAAFKRGLCAVMIGMSRVLLESRGEG